MATSLHSELLEYRKLTVALKDSAVSAHKFDGRVLFELHLVFHGCRGTENLIQHGHIYEEA
jgi:hypothetical protein